MVLFILPKAAGQPRSSCGKVGNARRTSVHELCLRPCNGRRRTRSGATRSELSSYIILLRQKSHSCNYRIVRTRRCTRLDERTGLFSDLRGALSALRSQQPKLEFRAAQLDGELGGPNSRLVIPETKKKSWVPQPSNILLCLFPAANWSVCTRMCAGCE